MTEDNINNKYLDIVDNAVMGQGVQAQDQIKDILRNKISDEIEDFKNEYAQGLFTEPAYEDDNEDSEEDSEWGHAQGSEWDTDTVQPEAESDEYSDED